MSAFVKTQFHTFNPMPVMLTSGIFGTCLTVSISDFEQVNTGWDG